MRRKTLPAALCLSCVLMAATGCSVGSHHTSDAVLARRFLEHESEFAALVSEVLADPRFRTVNQHLAFYDDGMFEARTGNFADLERLGMSSATWQHYQERLQTLGIEGGILRGGDSVEFRADAGTLSNGDSYKGIEYTPNPPKRLLETLDNYTLNDRDRDAARGWSVYRHLRGNWYLYLFVNP